MTTINTEKSGGTRFSKGKPGGWWYAPLYGLRLVAPVWMEGADKYAPRDWAEGQSFSTLVDCAMRHMLEICERGPWAKDPESGNYHAAHVVWNLLTLLTFIALGRGEEMDDITQWRGVTAGDKDATETTISTEPASGTTGSGTVQAPDQTGVDGPLPPGPRWPQHVSTGE